MHKTKLIKKQKKFEQKHEFDLKKKPMAAPKKYYEMRAAPVKPEERREDTSASGQ